MQQFEFIAPTGDELQGTSELIPVAYGIDFTGPDPSADFDHNGNNSEFDEAAKPIGTIGAPFFMDESGDDWPAHHLIPAGSEPLSAETLALFAREMALCRAFDAAHAAAGELRNLSKNIGAPETEPDTALMVAVNRDCERAGKIALRLADQYARAKFASIAAKDRELKAQAEASPRVECANCDWTGRERDCNEIKDIFQRVEPGETMPAGECPECGCLCHLVEKEEA